MAAARWAGMRSGNGVRNQRARPNERRHSAIQSAANSPAIIVMCRPEMLTRWLMPVRRKRSQSACAMPL